MESTHFTDDKPKQSLLKEKLNRRNLIKSVAVGVAAYALYGCSNEKNVVTNNVSAENIPTDQDAAGDQEVPAQDNLNNLSIDTSTLPPDERFVGQDYHTTDQVNDALENGTLRDLYGTYKYEVFSGGELDVIKAGRRYVDIFNEGVSTFCYPEYLVGFEEDVSPDGFVNHWSAHDTEIASGIAGLDVDEVVTTALYKEFHIAHKAALETFFLNAQHGCLEKVNLDLIGWSLGERIDYGGNDYGYNMLLDVEISNSLTGPNVPSSAINEPVRGEMELAIMVAEDSDVILYGRNTHRNEIDPIQEYVELAA